ncbi:MAG: hypothetical protein HQ558_05920 [Candidatus Omnitrophica bacterium]|nr:hypothetical protein [Candidatus Omnitrophota bacterium]
MKRYISVIIIAAFCVSLLIVPAHAGSSKTWSNIGKGLAIYEGVKVLTGRRGNIVDDVTGGMQPREGSSQGQPAQGGSFDDGYNAGYKKGYDDGYNAGFRNGVEHNRSQ